MLLARSGIWLNWFPFNSTRALNTTLPKDEVFLCDRILFHDIDHVNVNVFGLFVAVTSLAVL